ncbi:MAG: hypothetical protein EZS28_003935 [Streblomastix strix]|uniref:Pre-mRNA polyadenylation factor Fip1 domain-containing protein n=1 Tax=Streblomastix strix TaxID=222440 RepID=A0A5J4X022_9EUKA|nr:MAG: hypothetical protein EZS28_003935 [Streblomastix strix]
MQQSIYERDIENSQRLWLQQGYDLEDWFNYSFDEVSWLQYCERQSAMRQYVDRLKQKIQHNRRTVQTPILIQFPGYGNDAHNVAIPIEPAQKIQSVLIPPNSNAMPLLSLPKTSTVQLVTPPNFPLNVSQNQYQNYPQNGIK